MVVDGRFRLRVPELVSMPLGFCSDFFTRPSSMDMRYRERRSSLTSEAYPGAESVRMTVGGPSNGLIPTQSVINASCRVSRPSFSIMHVTVYDVTHSRTTNIYIGNSSDFWGVIRRLRCHCVRDVTQ